MAQMKVLNPSRPPATFLYAALAMITIFAIVRVLFINTYIPLMDFNRWLYQGYIIGEFWQGQPVKGFHFAHYPVPNSAAQAILALLCVLLPIKTAGKLFLLGYIVLALFVVWKFCRSRFKELTIPMCLIILTVIVFNATFWNGNINFQIGLLVILGYLTVPREIRYAPLVVLIFSLLSFFSHGVVFASFVLIVASHAILHRKPVELVCLLPSIAMLAWYSLVNTVYPQDSADVDGLIQLIVYKFYTVTKWGPYHNYVLADFGDWENRPKLYWIGVAVNVIYSFLLVAGLLYSLFKTIRLSWRLNDELLCGLALVIISVCMPLQTTGVLNPGERFLYVALILLIANLPLPRAIIFILSALTLFLPISLTAFDGKEAEFLKPGLALTDAKDSRTHVLYWHRSSRDFGYVMEAEAASAEGRGVRFPLQEFATSFLKDD